MELPKALARRIDKMQGEAHSYAVDYVAWWMEGGREPKVDDYIREDMNPRRFNHGRAREIAAEIRQAVRG